MASTTMSSCAATSPANENWVYNQAVVQPVLKHSSPAMFLSIPVKQTASCSLYHTSGSVPISKSSWSAVYFMEPEIKCSGCPPSSPTPLAPPTFPTHVLLACICIEYSHQHTGCRWRRTWSWFLAHPGRPPCLQDSGFDLDEWRHGVQR